ncbi:MAG: molybdopterin-dependent oxidoreductase [Coriobacteriales bacterium]|jgi:anaerobic selenocysteine-containing dehydrogenase|nr:molybdopterin-dependent oxidoreductase [Coriobacteriales bacterium]
MRELKMTRRTFVKSATVAGAAVALSSALTGCMQQGASSGGTNATSETGRVFYNSVCHGCIQACPCKVYVENGVVIKIEGHPDAPTSQGSLCLKGLNQIHTCYSPRRVLYPLKRTGARGAANAAWERISWDEAVDLAGTKIAEAIEKYGTYAFFCSVGGGGAYSFMQAMTVPMALGSPTVFEPGCAQCYLPRITEAAYMYGGADQSIADCAVLEPFKGLAPLEKSKGVTQDTKVLVLWAAQPSVSQTAQSGRGMAELRAAGCKTIVVDPNFSPDAVKATIHLPVRPGSDAALILAWYRVILDEVLYDEEFTKFYTNMPFLINPETHLPWLATEVFGAEAQTTPEDTPVYVCVDETTGEIAPLPFGDPKVVAATVNPKVLATAEVNGVTSRSAGQIYRDEAEPWTLERTAEFCWVPADRIRAAIDLYTSAPVAGIANGVASDMEETASQVPDGLMGLDMIMGYVNKPGATLTQNNPLPAEGEAERPTMFWNGFGGMFGTMYGIGYQVGATKEANEARIKSIEDGTDPEAPPFKNAATLFAMNQLLLDRLGMKNHRGLYNWCHSHIPTVREAIETGEPFKPRVWFDMSGNKFAVLGSAGAWYNAIMNDGVDFIICQYPMITSFQVECADLIFPLEEWLEATGASEFGQLNYSFPCPGIIHLGETVPNSVPPQRVVADASKKLNEKLGTVVFGTTGQTMQELNLQFPLGLGVMGGLPDEAAVWEEHVAKFKNKGIAGYDEKVKDKNSFMEFAKNNHDFYAVDEPSMYWTYGQHLVKAKDGLPVGFATESRKCEVYNQIHIKLSTDGFPYCYPRPHSHIDPRVGTWKGEYSPICNVPLQKEAPVGVTGDGLVQVDPEFPLAMTSGRVYYFHHGTMRHAPYARELYPAPFVRINPKTAAEYGIAHGDWVEISSRRTQGTDYDHKVMTGTEMSYSGIKEQNTRTAAPIRAIAYVAEVVAPGVLWMERFWNPECYDSTQANKTGGWQECNVNVITNAVDPVFNEVFGSYTNRGFAVNIKKSSRPANIWTQPKEFEPFMPTTANEYVKDVGVLRDNKALNTPIVAFAGAEGGK